MTGVPNGTCILCTYLELVMLGFYCSPSVQGYFRMYQIRFTPITFIAALRLLTDSECNQTFICLCSLWREKPSHLVMWGILWRVLSNPATELEVFMWNPSCHRAKESNPVALLLTERFCTDQPRATYLRGRNKLYYQWGWYTLPQVF